MSRIKLTSSGSSWRRTAVRLAFNESVPSKPRRKPEAVKGIRRTQLPGHGLGAIAPCRVAAVLVLALSRHFPGQAREGKVDDHAHGPAENRRQAMEVPLFCDGTLRSFRASELANESSLETGATPGEARRSGPAISAAGRWEHVYARMRVSTFCAEAYCESSVDMRWVQRSRPSAPPNETMTARIPSVFEVTMVRSESLVALP